MDSCLVQSRGGASGPALPQLGSLVAHFDASAIPPQTDGTAISTWTDTVSGIVANQSTGASQPLFKASGINGKQALSFNASRFLPIATPGAIATALTSKINTVIIVAANVQATSNGCMFGASAGGDSQFYFANGTNAGRFNATNTSFAATWGASASMLVMGVTSTTNQHHGSGSGFSRLYMQGGCVQGFVAPSPVPSSTYAIGAISAAGTLPFKGDLYDILIYSVELSPADMIRVQIHMANKYGLALPWSGTTGYVVFHGDSITNNVQASTAMTGYPYQSAQSLGLPYGAWSNLAVGGVNQENLILNAAEIAPIPALIGKRVVVAAFEFYNSRLVPDSAATMYSNASTYVSTVKAYDSNLRVVWGSDTSQGTFTEPDATRTNYNALLDATPLGDQYVQVHLNSLIGIDGSTVNNPTYFGGDHIHPSDLGYSQLHPMFTPAITSALAMA